MDSPLSERDPGSADTQGGTMTDSSVALITGGGSGIGAAVARRLLEAGQRVAVTGRGAARLRAFREELGDPEGLLTLVGDAADHTQVRSAVEATLKEFGRLDTVVATPGPPPTTRSPRATRPGGPRWR